ncbi:DUF4185 domain-containing protein [Ruania zhangjianzhongii]|uniref:DUF4185 domain-containing protein n=1 Tax=Ruania zhangjianzhongii TaxID=2603206 RepID=UPI0011CA0AEE|nr:DUF4185 domain-containing protein [Ruania zhangjianzhongii]
MDRRTLITSVPLGAGLAAIGIPFAGSATTTEQPTAVPSTVFATMEVEERASVVVPSVGDLWPSCWAEDDHLYAANGDGRGFGPAPGPDIAINRISGTPEEGDLTGTRLAVAGEVAPVWSGPDFNRKPTGIACVDGVLYVAVQDLAKHTFDSAPAATISRSTDHGRTWTWDPSGPMFSGGVFTTIMFLDYGKDYADAPDEYVYLYGIDHNWRQAQDVFLARVSRRHVQDRTEWQFFTGRQPSGDATWSHHIDARRPVLHDETRSYQEIFSEQGAHNLLPLAQGSVVYNRPLQRYFLTGWNAYQWMIYDAPTPWGPWGKSVKDFGGAWTPDKHGGYTPTIPTKFISADGRQMWVQSNVCGPCGAEPKGRYNFNLRRLSVTPADPVPERNERDGRNLALLPGAVAVQRCLHVGDASVLSDESTERSEDDWNNERKDASWWGYTWPRPVRVNELVYSTGDLFDNGGWFASDLRVQMRRRGVWRDVPRQQVSPAYPYSRAAGSRARYTFQFRTAITDGIRIIGRPGGERTFTSISELSAHFR